MFSESKILYVEEMGRECRKKNKKGKFDFHSLKNCFSRLKWIQDRTNKQTKSLIALI